jgi:hypothetical protein
MKCAARTELKYCSKVLEKDGLVNRHRRDYNGKLNIAKGVVNMAR